MKMIVGLGNPGRKYVGTRHNVGFEVIAKLAERFGAGRARSKFNAEIADVLIGGEKVWLVSPLTFMNRSGQATAALVDFFGVELCDLMVVADDMNLPVGRIRFRRSGSSGGQKGLEDIIRRLGSNAFPRLRIGIGRPPEGWDSADYVLGKIRDGERASLDPAIGRAVQGIELWVKEGIDSAMARFNSDPAADSDKRPKNRKKTENSVRENPEKDVDEN